ncbi:hypothetical protein BIY37_06935 [Candidatus Brocadia sapporoensis]|uniref:Uncharacterized protein n=1 Tax=Candidatus Brocadia sapporoensis TaxID=392547 RepID=A0A1V6LZV0_9BACT|nr:hypothetical protein [Candidatus Brocadia sapporoensis]OQD45694.1 hypothetical protein BIY37_06935 [Candidatus Brocadia sapporoensis]
MTVTFTFFGMHFVFRANDRVPWQEGTLYERLFVHIGGIIRRLVVFVVQVQRVSPLAIHSGIALHLPVIPGSTRDPVFSGLLLPREWHIRIGLLTLCV